eukprot:182327-Chlamydomonas_euryale.AAC.6
MGHWGDMHAHANGSGRHGWGAGLAVHAPSMSWVVKGVACGWVGGWGDTRPHERACTRRLGETVGVNAQAGGWHSCENGWAGGKHGGAWIGDGEKSTEVRKGTKHGAAEVQGGSMGVLEKRKEEKHGGAEVEGGGTWQCLSRGRGEKHGGA